MKSPTLCRLLLTRFAYAMCFAALVSLTLPATSMAAPAPPTVVDTTYVKTMNIPHEIHALGSLSPINQATVSSDTDGRIVQILYQNGQVVVKGMPVVQLDARQANSFYKQSVTTYQLSRIKYKNGKALENEAVSTQELLTLKANMDNKFALMQSAQVALNELTISAPIDGQLGSFQVNTGDYVKAGKALVRLTDIRHLRVQFQVPETDLPRLKLGQLVTVTSDVYPKKSFFGTVTYISPTINPATRSITLQATIDNTGKTLRPGLFVSIAEKIGVLKNATVVPSQAILADIQGYYVYAVKGDRVARKAITQGERYHGKVVVIKGLSPGDVVVLSGQSKLHDAAFISVRNGPKSTEEASS